MNKKDEALKLALEALEWLTAAEPGDEPPINEAITAIREALADSALDRMADNARELGLDYMDLQDKDPELVEQPCTYPNCPCPCPNLPDGSAFAVVSYPLPKDHWLYAERQYEEGAEEPIELGKPILTHALRDAVVAAVRYAIRGATNCGKESDFDPDALVQNAVYALCGPFTSPQPAQQQEPVACVNGCQGFFKHSPQPAQRKPLTDDPLQGAVDWLLEADGEYFCTATVQRTLRIGYNRAKRLCDTAKERAAHGIKGDA